METLGRSFGFHIKHWQLIDTLYRNPQELGRKSLLNSLPDSTRTMVERVGKKAGEQAADFMDLCGNELTKYFGEFPNCKLKKRTQRSTMEKDWYVEFSLRPKRGTKKLKWTIGFSIDYMDISTIAPPKQSPVLSVYLWTKGGEPAESNTARILGKRVKYRSEIFGWRSGSVIIGEPIPIKCNKSFDVSTGPLVKRVKSTLRKILKKDMEKLFVA